MARIDKRALRKLKRDMKTTVQKAIERGNRAVARQSTPSGQVRPFANELRKFGVMVHENALRRQLRQ